MRRGNSIAAILAVWLVSLTSFSAAWTISSRELVDLQFARDDSLVILVSAPAATKPGVYLWRLDQETPLLVCELYSPIAFSFDRKLVIERVAGTPPELRIYDATTCRLTARLNFEGVLLDADARGAQIALAVRLADGERRLQLYSKRGRMLADTEIGRNVEMGFAPDGRSLVNFDLSDSGAAAWKIPALSPFKLPHWIADGETTFVAGSGFVKRYRSLGGDDAKPGETLTIVRWPGGEALYKVNAPSSVRLRQLSRTGRFGMLHTSGSSAESLEQIDFVTQKRVKLVSGNIDHASVSFDGRYVAWALRSGNNDDLVQLQRAQVDSSGGVVSVSRPSNARR